ncbi:hypothetical protein [Ekhidna sp.]
MLSTKKCEEILNKKGKKYKQKEVALIRDFLYQMADLMLEINKLDDEES